MVNKGNLTTEPEVKEVEHIEEVVFQKEEEDISFVELYEQNLQDVAIGKVVMGKVVQINDDAAMVDVG